MDHVVLLAALWGYISSWVNEIIKQDHWPKVVNTIIANAVVLLSATVVAFTNGPHSALTVHVFTEAVLAAFTAAVINHTFVLVPTGIGKKLQSATSARLRRPPQIPPAAAA